MAVYLGIHARQAGLVRDAGELGAAGQFVEAERTAARVTRAPADARALVLRARAFTQQGRYPEAEPFWRAAARRAPNDWILQLDWARAAMHSGRDVKAARAPLRRALELNPRLAVPQDLLAAAP